MAGSTAQTQTTYRADTATDISTVLIAVLGVCDLSFGRLFQ